MLVSCKLSLGAFLLFNVIFFRMTENDRESLVNVFYNEANKGGDEGNFGLGAGNSLKRNLS